MPRYAHSLMMLVLLVSMVMANEIMDDNRRSSDLKDIRDYRRALRTLERILSKADEPESDDIIAPLKKRTCYFNGGMSHSCDYKELLKSVNDANYWSSEYTPGRRRKRQIIPQQQLPSALF